MNFLAEIKKWLGEVTEIALLLVALGIVVEILFGSAVPFFSGANGIVANLTTLITALGENGLVGLIALSIILFLFYRKRAVA